MPANAVAIQFGLLSPTEVRARAVVLVVHEEDLDDPRMGANTLLATCATCSGDMTQCPGHLGAIELAEPVYHVLLIDAVVRTLARVCLLCGTVRRGRTCAACDGDGFDGKCARFTVTGDRVFDRHAGTNLSAAAARKVLQRIADSDLDELGWHADHSRPEWAVLTVLPVLPPSARPAAVRTNGRVCHDGLTYKYREIARLNGMLRSLRKAPPHVRNDFLQRLQWHVTTLLNSDERFRSRAAAAFAADPQRRGASANYFSGLKQRLTGKDGRMRLHLMGKRTDFCARTVISPDPNIALDEVGVPEQIATRLSVPVRVTACNLAQAARWVAIGPGRRGGANYYTDGGGRRYHLAAFDVHTLRIGDVVERVLQDGDVVVMNRQPTLHRGSLMAHRVKILSGKTLRLNVSITTPYNAGPSSSLVSSSCSSPSFLNTPPPREMYARARTCQLYRSIFSYLPSSKLHRSHRMPRTRLVSWSWSTCDFFVRGRTATGHSAQRYCCALNIA